MLRLFKQGSMLIQWLLIGQAVIIPIILTRPLNPCFGTAPLSPCNWLDQTTMLATGLQTILQLLVIIGASILLRKARLISFTAFLPSLVTVFVFQIIAPEGLSADQSLSLLLILLAVMQLFRRAERDEGLQEIFIASFLMSTAGMVTPLFGLSIFIVLGYLILFRAYQWRQWVAALIGLIVPHLIVLMYYFWFDRLPELLGYYQEFIPNGSNLLGKMQGWNFIAMPMLAITFLYSLFSNLSHLPDKKIQVRAQISMLAYLLILGAIITVIYHGDTLFVLGLPLALLLSIRMLEMRKKQLAGIVLFLLFVLYSASVLNSYFDVA